MSQSKPLSQFSVSKDDVTMDHGETSLEQSIKMEEVDLEPDYIEYSTYVHTDVTAMDEQMDNCGIKEELVDEKQNVPVFNNTMDIESGRLDMIAHTNVRTRNNKSQHDDGNSEIFQNIQITNVKSEIETNDGTSVEELNKLHESDTDVYQAETSNIILNKKTVIHKTKIRKKCSLKQGLNKTKLIKNMKLHSGKGGRSTKHSDDKPFSCDICHYKSSRKAHLVVHMRTHTGEKPFTCDICDYKSIQKRCLTSHMRIHTGEKPFSCDMCDYKCIQKKYLKQHMTVHTGEKPYSCNICDYKCAQKCNLTIHMRTHTGEKPYSCDICDYKATQKKCLTNHITVHTGEKPFSCVICNYKCVRKGDLSSHKRVHTGEKLYSCDICDYKCKEKKSLVAHNRIHTGEKPFSCDVCGYKCSRKSSLSTHKKKHCQ